MWRFWCIQSYLNTLQHCGSSMSSASPSVLFVGNFPLRYAFWLWPFWKSGWNVFDFVVVTIGILNMSKMLSVEKKKHTVVWVGQYFLWLVFWSLMWQRKPDGKFGCWKFASLEVVSDFWVPVSSKFKMWEEIEDLNWGGAFLSAHLYWKICKTCSYSWMLLDVFWSCPSSGKCGLILMLFSIFGSFQILSATVKGNNYLQLYIYIYIFNSYEYASHDTQVFCMYHITE